MRLALLFNPARADTLGGYYLRACRVMGLGADQWSVTGDTRPPAGYDLYLRIDHGDDYLVEWPPALRPRAFVVSDTHLPHSWKKIRRIAAHYDVMCCAQSRAADALPNGAWLPFACDPGLHYPTNEPKQWDVAFVGTDGAAPRKFILQALRERYSNSLIGAAPHTAIASIYSRARVGFNYSIAHEVNMRVFEVLATRTCLVTNALPGAELERLGLVDGRHLVIYRTLDDLVPLMDELLADADRREEIAQAGAEVVRARHTYAHRIAHLLSLLSQRGALARTFAPPSELWAARP